MTNTAWIALSLTGRIGNKTLQALLKHFDGDPQAILAADVKKLQQVAGVGPKIAQSIREIDLKRVEKAMQRWRRAGIRAMPMYDDDYPPRLRLLDDAPPTLFVRGNWQPNFAKSVAIVGTRQPTEAARKLAQNLSTALVEKDYAVISGMAVGIDSAAHYGALIVPKGYTLAVLGCGVTNIYPQEHERLAQVVMKQGAILSEVNPAGSTSPSQLVARNRIISGLSDAVVVIETETDGGAMYAARFAAQQGRPIYTVKSQASGNRALIADGAGVIDWHLQDLPF
jgi:DNA processing protein